MTILRAFHISWQNNAIVVHESWVLYWEWPLHAVGERSAAVPIPTARLTGTDARGIFRGESETTRLALLLVLCDSWFLKYKMITYILWWMISLPVLEKEGLFVFQEFQHKFQIHTSTGLKATNTFYCPRPMPRAGQVSLCAWSLFWTTPKSKRGSSHIAQRSVPCQSSRGSDLLRCGK